MAWLLYSLLISAKISVFSASFGKKLAKNDVGAFGTGILIFVLALSSVIVLLLVLSHQCSQSKISRHINYGYIGLRSAVDVLDAVMLVGVSVLPNSPTLWRRNSKNIAFQTLFSMEPKQNVTGTTKNESQTNTVFKSLTLLLICLNFTLPTIGLFKLRYRKGVPSGMSEQDDKISEMVYLLVANVPNLILRLKRTFTQVLPAFK